MYEIVFGGLDVQFATAGRGVGGGRTGAGWGTRLQAWGRAWRGHRVERGEPAWNGLAPGMGLAEAVAPHVP